MQVLGLFSKVVGAQPQGALLGWFGSAGSLARIGFPVIAGTMQLPAPVAVCRHFLCTRRPRLLERRPLSALCNRRPLFAGGGLCYVGAAVQQK